MSRPPVESGSSGFAVRFARHVREGGAVRPGERLVVACSGGLDSTVLLHLLRFAADLPPFAITAAHFDHRMRVASSGDLHWLNGLTAAWDIQLVSGEAEAPATSEREAREQRYAFLAAVRKERGAAWILTAHHADDQAETVLFRILRGTGPGGLAGIPERGRDRTYRPLLPFARRQIRAYAENARIGFRHDDTNTDDRFARNVLRHEILPRVESMVAPGARTALLRLARLADRDEDAWRSLMPGLLEGIGLLEASGRVSFDREAFLDHREGVRARLLREAARRAGSSLDEAGTAALLEFTSSGVSGARRSLPSGFVLTRQFDRFVILFPRPKGPDDELSIPDARAGAGKVVLGGRSFGVRWGAARASRSRWVECFDASRLAFPLRLRGWVAGDRIRLRYGSKKLAKMFAEARVPVEERRSRPVLVDGSDRVLWVPGLARSLVAAAGKPVENVVIEVAESETE